MYPCPRCKQFALVERSYTNWVGIAVIVLGIFLAFFTCGFGLLISILGLLIRDRYMKCNACGWIPPGV